MCACCGNFCLEAPAGDTEMSAGTSCLGGAAWEEVAGGSSVEATVRGRWLEGRLQLFSDYLCFGCVQVFVNITIWSCSTHLVIDNRRLVFSGLLVD